MALESIYGGATLSHSGLGSDGSRALYESQLLDEDIVSVVYDDRFLMERIDHCLPGGLSG